MIKESADNFIRLLEFNPEEFDHNATYKVPLLIDFYEHEINDLTPEDLAEDDDCSVGMMCRPINWCSGKGKEKLSYEVVADDWRSVTFKVSDEIYAKVRREMIYDYCSKD